MSNKPKAKFNRSLFVGCSKESIGYQFYNTLEQRLFVSKYTFFLEKEFLLSESKRPKNNLAVL